jgi:aryl-alcohol dehydrogenase-like predicted oxidoreductase
LSYVPQAGPHDPPTYLTWLIRPTPGGCTIRLEIDEVNNADSSEQRIGRLLAGRPRAEFVLSTKVGRRLVPAAGDIESAEGFHGTPELARVRDYSRDGTLATLEGSLRRLGTDRIDIALIHDPDDYAEKL